MMKEIRKEAVDNILDSLIAGRHNSQALLEMVEVTDGGYPDMVEEFKKRN